MTPIRMLRTALAAASAMMLLAGTAQAADGMDVASAKTIYSQGAKADYLAGYHMKKKVADCSTCHPNDKVTDAQSRNAPLATVPTKVSARRTWPPVRRSALTPGICPLIPAQRATADTKPRLPIATTATFSTCR